MLDVAIIVSLGREWFYRKVMAIFPGMNNIHIHRLPHCGLGSNSALCFLPAMGTDTFSGLGSMDQ